MFKTQILFKTSCDVKNLNVKFSSVQNKMKQHIDQGNVKNCKIFQQNLNTLTLKIFEDFFARFPVGHLYYLRIPGQLFIAVRDHLIFDGGFSWQTRAERE